MLNKVTLFASGYEGLDIVSTTKSTYLGTMMFEKIQAVGIDSCFPTLNLFKNNDEFDKMIKWNYFWNKNEGGQSVSKGLGIIKYEDAQKEYELSPADITALNEIISDSSYVFVVATLDSGFTSFIAVKICELCREMGKPCELFAALPLRGVHDSFDNNARTALAAIQRMECCGLTSHIFDSEDYVPENAGSDILIRTATAVRNVMQSDLAEKLKEHIYRSGIFAMGEIAREAAELFERTMPLSSEYHCIKFYAEENGDDMNAILKDKLDEVLFVADITQNAAVFMDHIKEAQTLGLYVRAFVIHNSEILEIADYLKKIPERRCYDYENEIGRLCEEYGVGESDARTDIIREISLRIKWFATRVEVDKDRFPCRKWHRRDYLE